MSILNRLAKPSVGRHKGLYGRVVKEFGGCVYLDYGNIGYGGAHDGYWVRLKYIELQE